MNAQQLPTFKRRVASADSSEYLIYGKIAESVEACLAAGQEPDIEALAAEYPAHADQIRQLVPAFVTLRQIGHELEDGTSRSPLPSGPSGQSRGSDGDAAESPATPDRLGQLGDFHIVREIGRGGMGIVYEAEQISMRRRVALKVLPFAAVMDVKQIQRFKNEAQAAGQLQHTNIVPVYFVGCERGAHFYAMQFIEGQTMADVIRELRQAAGLEKEGVIGDRVVGDRVVGFPTTAEDYRSPITEHVSRSSTSLHLPTCLPLHRAINQDSRILPHCRSAGRSSRRGPRSRP